MFTHLLQIASFKSKPQNFKAITWVVVIFGLLFAGVQGFAMSLTPGNELIRVLVAGLFKVIVLAALLLGWIRSIDRGTHYSSTLLVLFFVSLLSEIVKLPMVTMIRDAKLTSDMITAIIISIPLVAVTVWQYAVWFYTLKVVSDRTKGEVVAVIITLVLISEVVGSVLSEIGAPLGGFS